MTDREEDSCNRDPAAGGQYDPVEPRKASGKAPVLVEIVCERVHCVLYDYAISTVDMIVEIFGDLVDIQTVIRQGGRENAQRFLDLCVKAGKMLRWHLPVSRILASLRQQSKQF